MKISELMQEVSESLPLLPAVNPMLLLKDQLIQFEQVWAVSCLKGLIEKNKDADATEENLKPFYNFLARRWQHLRGIYQLSYNYNYSTPLTEACLALAVALASTTNNEKHHLEILMPTLQTHNANIMLDLKEIDNMAAPVDKIKLQHFILDRWDRIIHIQDCLTYAIEDKTLKHTSAHYIEEPEIIVTSTTATSSSRRELEAGEIEDTEMVEAATVTSPKASPLLLDDREINRVIYHSKESRGLYKCIIEYQEENEKEYNVVDALTNLIEYLRMGGERGHYGGTGQVAALHSFIGIRKFYDFTKKLVEKDFQILMTASCLYENTEYTFKKVWVELLSGALGCSGCEFTEAEKDDIHKLTDPCFAEDFKETEKKVAPFKKKLVKLNKKIANLKKEILNVRGLAKREKTKQLKLLEKEKESVVKEFVKVRGREILCSEQFALRIEEIVKACGFLKDIKPVIGVTTPRAKLKKEKNYLLALDTFKKAYQKSKFKHFSAAELNALNVKSLYDFFTVSAFCQRLITNPYELMEILSTLLPVEHPKIIIAIGNQALKNMLSHASEIITVSKWLQGAGLLITQRQLFTTLGKEYLAEKFPRQDTDSIHSLQDTVPIALFATFFPPPKSSTRVINLILMRQRRTDTKRKSRQESDEESAHDDHIDKKQRLPTAVSAGTFNNGMNAMPEGILHQSPRKVR
jgi:hypothetical protein